MNAAAPASIPCRPGRVARSDEGIDAEALARGNKGPGPGEEEWLTTSEREWTVTTGKTAAQNIVAVARALAASPIPAPPS
jgi:hypothetical protein